VTLSYRREKLVRIKKKNEERFAPLAASGRIKTAFGSRVVEVGPQTVRLQTGPLVQEIPNDYVFVFAGGEAPFAFLKHCGVRFGGPATDSASPAPA
jgi:thioredoxin reductase (NADPH)